MDEMVSGGVQKGGEVKSWPAELRYDITDRASFASETYKKDGALLAKTRNQRTGRCFSRIGAESH